MLLQIDSGRNTCNDLTILGAVSDIQFVSKSILKRLSVDMSRLVSTILLFLTLMQFNLFVNPAGAEGHHPFWPGEKMHFVLKYGPIPAGTATLEVHDMDKIKDLEAYHFVLTARSNSFIDIFFKVRDRIDSYTDTGMNHSLYYKKDQKEGKTRRYIRVDFDWEKKESTYVNFDTEPKTISLMPGTFDPLSVFLRN